MSLSPEDRASLLTELLGRLRALESASNLSLETRVAMDDVLVDALPDKTFGGAVSASWVTHVPVTLPDGREEDETVRLLTMSASKFVPSTPADPDPAVDAALLVATLALDDAPVYVESANVERLASEILDAAFSGAEGDASLWLDAVAVRGYAMTRCACVLVANEAAARSARTSHSGLYARSANGRAAAALARMATAQAPWANLARAAFGRVATLRAPTRDAAHVIGRTGVRTVDLTRIVPPTRAALRRMKKLPAPRFQPTVVAPVTPAGRAVKPLRRDVPAAPTGRNVVARPELRRPAPKPAPVRGAPARNNRTRARPEVIGRAMLRADA